MSMKTKQLLIAALLATGMTAQAQNEPLDLSTVTRLFYFSENFL